MIFLVPAMVLTTPISVGPVEVALLLCVICLAWPLWRIQKLQAPLLRTSYLLSAAFLFNFIVALISLLSTGFDPRFIENPSKMLLATFGIGVILLLRPDPRWFWFGLFAGIIGATSFAFFQRFVLMMPRAEGFSMPITFGNLAMAMGLMSLAGIQPFSKTRWMALPYLAFFVGVVASILSGSRGGWLALLLSFVPFYSYGRHTLGRRTIVIIVASLMLLGAAGILPQTGLRERLTEVSTELTLYSNGNPDSSVGARLEMWKGAWTMFVEHPLTGVGRANYYLGLNNLIARGDINPAMHDYHHAHNELLNALATQGLLGAFALIAIYAAPLLFFTRQLRLPGQHQPYALAGVLLVLSFIDFGLTQVMFAHHASSSFYALTVCILVGLCLQEQQRASHELAAVASPAPVGLVPVLVRPESTKPD